MIRKGIFFGVIVFAFISFSFVVTQSFVQARLTDFEEVDAYINTKMKDALKASAAACKRGQRIAGFVGGWLAQSVTGICIVTGSHATGASVSPPPM